MPGMRWSASTSASDSPRLRSSFSVSCASRARAGTQDAIRLAELAAEVALDRAQDGRLVVDHEQRGAAGAGPRGSLAGR